jgi:cyclic pyranopterin phosphate synthase
MVVLAGVNDDEVETIAEFCLSRGLTLRLIETMPMGETGRAASQCYVDLQRLRERLAAR